MEGMSYVLVMLMLASVAHGETDRFPSGGYGSKQTQVKVLRTNEPMYSEEVCYVRIPASVQQNHKNCKKYRGEFDCRARQNCKWEGRLRLCSGKDYSRCPASIRSLCTDVKLVRKLPGDDYRLDRQFICDPSQIGNPLTSAEAKRR